MVPRYVEFIYLRNNNLLNACTKGCLLYALTYGGGYSPFEHPIQGVLTLGILQGKVKFPPGGKAQGYTYSQEWQSLITSMLNVSPGKRPHLKEVGTRLRKLSGAEYV